MLLHRDDHRPLHRTEQLIPRSDADGDTVNRFWLITIEGFDPLLVQATAGAGDEEWLDLVGATTIATLQLGHDGPAVEG